MNRIESTKLGIAKARACGVVWGRHGAVLATRNKDDAREFAESLRSLLLDLMRVRRIGPRPLARKLNEKGVPAKNGGQWYPATTDRLLKRLGPSFKEEQKKLMDATFYNAVGGGPSDDAGDRRCARHTGPRSGSSLRRT